MMVDNLKTGNNDDIVNFTLFKLVKNCQEQKTKMKYFRVFIILFVFCLDVIKEFKSVSSFDLTVLHLNDIHARIEQTDKYTGFCDKDESG